VTYSDARSFCQAYETHHLGLISHYEQELVRPSLAALFVWKRLSFDPTLELSAEQLVELNRITRLTAPSDETGEAEYWITDVREYEDMQGFEVLDCEQSSIAQFLYADAKQADIARERMFGALRDVVSIATSRRCDGT
jgi:hypothetical protein